MRNVLTRLALQIPSSAFIIVYQTRDFITAPNRTQIYVRLALQTGENLCDVARTARLFLVEEGRLRALGDANLRRRAAQQRHLRVDTLQEIKEQQILFVHDFIVDATFAPFGIRWHQQPIEVAVFDCIVADETPANEKHDEYYQAKDVRARALRQRSLEILVVLQTLSCRRK